MICCNATSSTISPCLAHDASPDQLECVRPAASIVLPETLQVTLISVYKQQYLSHFSPTHTHPTTSTIRTTSIFALAALTVSVSASRYFTCSTGPLSNGVLEIVKNGNETTLLALASDDSLIRSPSGSQNIFEFVPCTSKFLGHPATAVSKGKVMAYGRVLGTGGCLTRDTASGKILTKACIAPDDSRQAQQFWNVTLVDHGDDEATGVSTLAFVAPGFYTQLMNGQVYQAKSKPVSKWNLRFTYTE